MLRDGMIQVSLYQLDKHDLADGIKLTPENNWKITPEGLYWSWIDSSGEIIELVPWHRIRSISQTFLNSPQGFPANGREI